MPPTEAERDAALGTYLNDHLAGAVAAIEVTEHLLGHSDGAQETFLRDLLARVEEDQTALKDVIARLGSTEDRLKTSASWLGEKLDRFKFAHDAEERPDLSDVEELEVLCLSIYGKHTLWRTLAQVLNEDERFADIDFERLKNRAQRQLDDAERFRMQAALQVFVAPSRSDEQGQSL